MSRAFSKSVASRRVAARRVLQNAVARSVVSRPMAEGLEARRHLSITPIVTASGQISLTTDGLGSNDVNGGTISTVKPAGATLRGAYLMSATAAFTGRTIANGDVSVDGAGVNFTKTVASSISSFNYFADVTSLVKSKINGAAAGTINFNIKEKTSGSIDGEALAVIYNDPNQTTSNTIVLLFGAQTTTGDTFNVGLATPFDSTVNKKFDMALGISFGEQRLSQLQFSTVNVDGTPLTGSGGGEDDGAQVGGELITVGGIGDSDANPTSPTAPPNKTDKDRSDDELYNIAPLVKNGATSIAINTKNPSNDDNIFFSALSLQGTTAVVGEGATLSPPTSTADVGKSVPLTATLQDTNGKAIANRQVTLKVISGPDSGTVALANTDSSGKVVFNLAGKAAGTDTVTASFLDSTGKTSTSNSVTVTYAAVAIPETITLAPASSTASVGDAVALTATVVDGEGPCGAQSVTFKVNSGPDAGTTKTVVTDANGKAVFDLTGKAAGTDLVTASVLAEDGSKTLTSNQASVKFSAVVIRDQPPAVNAGPDKTATAGTAVTLKGSATDVDSTLVDADFTWIVMSGAHVQVASGTGPNITFTPSTAGTYTAKLTVDDQEGGIGSDTALIDASPVVTAKQAVTSYVLVNADTDKDIETITAGETINLATLPTRHLNIRATTNPTPVGSVKLTYDGKTVIENTVPYAVLGDEHGDFFSRTLAVGSHTLAGTPYTLSAAKGTAGTTLSIGFKVIDQSGPAISSLELYNTDTETEVEPLTEGLVINTTTLGDDLTVRAFTTPSTVGSVKFTLDGHSVIENVEPYTLFENLDSDFFTGHFKPGNHTLVVTPFAIKNAGGLAGGSLTVHFSVTANAK